MKTSVSTLVSDIKILGDYSITDSSLDALVLKAINYAVRRARNWMLQFGIYEDTTANSSFKTIAQQSYVDITKAHIVGNTDEFTGTAGDTVTVTIDGTAYAGISLAAATTIALVVTAINTAVGSTVASEDENGYLMITSLTTGSSSAVTIADTAGTATDSLFEADADKTQSAIVDMDDILKITDRSNDRFIEIIPYQRLLELYPDPASNLTTTPDVCARANDYIYFGPTPSAGTRFYIDYFKMMSVLTSSDTMPFTTEYDELIVAIALEWLYSFLDSKDRTSILTAKERVAELRKILIVDSPKRIGMVKQSRLRGELLDLTAINPRTPD